MALFAFPDFIFSFQQFLYYVPMSRFLHAYSLLGLLNLVDLEVDIFLHIWKISV
jgi:hypothetical protein